MMNQTVTVNIPGGCSFESDICWWQTSGWSRYPGPNRPVPYAPLSDHSTNSSDGHFLVADLASGQANVASFYNQHVPATSNKSQCLTFWYYLFAQDRQLGYLRVIAGNSFENETIESNTILWQLKGQSDNKWHFAQVNISRMYTTRSYKLIFETNLGSQETGVAAVDDTLLEIKDCSTSPDIAQPTPPSVVDCSFDNGPCDWQPAKGIPYNFTYTNTRYVTGTRYYLSADSSVLPENSLLYLLSPTLPPANIGCFTMVYRATNTGFSDISLLMLTGSSSIAVWRLHSNNNRWQSASVNIANKWDHKLMLKVKVGIPVYGSVAIDDIKLNHGACKREGIYNFEDGNSNEFTQVPASDFLWPVKRADSTILAVDHTYTSPLGHFLQADLKPVFAGSSSQVESPYYPPTREECFFFWYVKLGSNTSTLSILKSVQSVGEEVEMEALWDTVGSTTSWTRAYVDIFSSDPYKTLISTTSWTRAYVDIFSSDPYKLIFQVDVGINHLHDEVYLDDISFSTLPCPEIADCDFEGSFVCGYTSSSADEVLWRLVSASNPDTVMPVDHTTLSDRGSYMEVDFPMSTPRKLSIRLTSQPLIAAAVRCFSFWFYGRGSGVLKLYITTESYESILLERAVSDDFKHRSERTWRNFRVDITDTTLQYTVTIEADGYPNSSFAVDDITSVQGQCVDMEKSGDIQANFGPQLDPGKRMVGCDFENGTLCGFQPDNKTDLNWSIFSSSSRHTKSTGLNFDQTTSSKFGHHIYMDASGKNVSSVARLVSPIVNTGGKICVSFYYGMYGSSVDRLALYVRQAGQGEKLYWTRSGNHGQRWIHQMVEVAGDYQPTQVIFEGVVGRTAESDIDLDEVWIYNQPCPPNGYCDFEDEESCDLEQDNMDDDDWTFHFLASSLHRLAPLIDHTYGTGEGHYLYKNLSTEQTTGELSRLLTPLLDAASVHCLTFWYYISNPPQLSSSHVLAVRTRDESGQETDLGVLKGRGLNTWNSAHFSIDHRSTEKFQIIFESQKVGSYGAIGIDDIELLTESCYTLVNCALETDTMCNWHQSSTDASPPWEIIQDDHYMRVSFTNRPGPPQISTVVSELVPSTHLAEFCFTFSYMMFGDNIGCLNVSLHDVAPSSQTPPPQVDLTVLSECGEQGVSTWHTAHINKPQTFNSTEFQIAISASSTLQPNSTKLGEIRIANIQLFPHSCLQEENVNYTCRDSQTVISLSKVCDFIRDCPASDDEENCGTCSFDSNFCHWVDASLGSEKFGLASSIPGNNMPLNYLGQNKGDYVAVEGDPDTSQTLIDLVLTQELGPSPPQCVLRFLYYLHVSLDSELGDLFVVLEEGGEETVIWRSLRVSSTDWHEAQAMIDNIHSRFKLHFRANQLGYLQTIAIDNIEFVNCMFPVSVFSSGVCAPPMFACKTNVTCVQESSVCDYTDNCGDGADEDTNMCSAYVRDNFEYSLGNWQQDQGDDLDWHRHQGQGVNVYDGPRRDHTLGTHFGHYMLFETAGQQAGQRSRLLSPMFAPSDQCKMRWHVYMYGTNPAHLTVSVRTTVRGPETVVSELKESLGDTWESRVNLLNIQTDFQVVIEGEATGLHSSNIGVDDISFSLECVLSNKTLPEGSAAPTSSPPCGAGQFMCTSGQCINQSLVCDFVTQCMDASDEAQCGSCTFEAGECGWTDESLGDKVWSLLAAGTVGTPYSDHTFSATAFKGHYLMLDHGVGVADLPAYLVGPTLTATGSDCSMGVYVFIDNPGNVAVEFGLRNGTDPFRAVITLTSVHIGPSSVPGGWLKYSYHIGALPSGSQAFVKASVVNTSATLLPRLLLDDISFNNCQPDVVSNLTDATCDFEQDFCGYFNDYTQTGQWVRSVATPAKSGPQHDHTTGQGYFIYTRFNPDFNHQQTVARLLTGVLDASGLKDGCLSFFYNLVGLEVSLNVFLVEERNQTLIFTQSNVDNTWTYGQARVTPTQQFQVHFQSAASTLNLHHSIHII
ncbi:MAM and LDL-receptor class A domain-containing protein 2-like [Physella acuta]|uniref:MAM and LDL-receptor class A domain-containing protein 2-like n=1 Tax=Physella acuta TaxID=109671 RepID=UPI0027DC3EE2|nr:MAM and LDL-receptor class A domain-containing protein 2-like [Physella acuta]